MFSVEVSLITLILRYDSKYLILLMWDPPQNCVYKIISCVISFIQFLKILIQIFTILITENAHSTCSFPQRTVQRRNTMHSIRANTQRTHRQIFQLLLLSHAEAMKNISCSYAPLLVQFNLLQTKRGKSIFLSRYITLQLLSLDILYFAK